MQPVQGSEEFIEMVLQVLAKDRDAFAGQGLDQLDGSFQSLLGLMRHLQVVKRCDRLQRLADFSATLAKVQDQLRRLA